MFALFAALQLATAPSVAEPVWIRVEVTDNRGLTPHVVEIIPFVTNVGGSRRVALVAAKQTLPYLAPPGSDPGPEVEWADSRRCAALRPVVDSLARTPVLEGQTIASAFEGLIPPPPSPHRTTARVKVAGLDLWVTPGTPLGLWTQRLFEATERCWGPEKPQP